MSEAAAVATEQNSEVNTVPVGSLESLADYAKRRDEIAGVEPVDEVEAKPEPKPEAKADDSEPDPSSEAGKELAKKKNSLQARIDELTRKNGETERQFRQREAELLARLAALEGKKPEADGNKAEPDSKAEYKRIMALPGAPKVSDFDSYEEYTFAAGEFVAEVKATEREQRQQQGEAQRSAAEAQSRAYKAAKEAHPDVDEVMTSFLDAGGFFSPAAQDVILNHPLGHEVAYALAKDPALNAQIAAIKHPGLAMIELGKVIERVEAASKASKAEAKTEEKPAPKVSKAPAPVEPVTEGAATANGPDPANISSIATWRKVRSQYA